MELTPEKLEFWENLYQTKKTPWDLGKPAPPLATFLQSPYAMAPGKMAVLGCGRGHECVLFAQKGFQVTGIDFAPSAVAETTQRLSAAGCLGTSGFLLQKNFFDIHEYYGYTIMSLSIALSAPLNQACAGLTPGLSETFWLQAANLSRSGGLFPRKRADLHFTCIKAKSSIFSASTSQ